MSKFVEDNEIRIPYNLYGKFGIWTLFSKEDFLSFEEAREFVRKLKIKSSKEWQEYSKSDKRPNNIPSAPDTIYINEGWISWGDFLGTGNVGKKDFLPFEEAREFVRKLKFKRVEEWQKYSKSGKKPNNIPYHPERTYKDKEWISMGDFLGTGNVRKKDFLSFKEARKFVKKLKLKSQKEWQKYCKLGKKPNNIPSDPQRVYKNKGWISMGDFLGTENIASKNRIFLSFQEARKFTRKLKLKGNSDWRAYNRSGKKPNNIPSSPEGTYKNKGWTNWPDFLGK